MAMSHNAYNKLCQLKSNDINFHMYRHVGFGTNFGIQFDISSIILEVFI